MTNGGQEFTGKTVDEAIDLALTTLGVSRDALQIEIVSKGSRGILGFGSEPALIRVQVNRTPAPDSAPVAPVPPSSTRSSTPDSTPQATAVPEQKTEKPEAAAPKPATPPQQTTSSPAPVAASQVDEDAGEEAAVSPAEEDDELAEMASELLAKVVELMGFEADIVTGWREPDEEDSQPYLLLDIQGDDLGALIGRRGETLASLQYLLRLMVNQRLRQWKNIVVDVEQYKQRRVTQLTQLAQRMAQQVVDSGRSVTLEPMPANERRIIHLALRDHPQVFTESIGEGDRRKVSIMPKH